jgi:hypothetical protein
VRDQRQPDAPIGSGRVRAIMAFAARPPLTFGS